MRRTDAKDAPDRREMSRKGHCAQCGSPVGRYGNKFCGYECAIKGRIMPTKKPRGFVDCSICLRKAGIGLKTIIRLLPVTNGWLSVAWRKAGFNSSGIPTWKGSALKTRRKEQAHHRQIEREREYEKTKPLRDAMAAIEKLRRQEGRPTGPRTDLTSSIFGRLRVVKYEGFTQRKEGTKQQQYHRWLCECECGKAVTVTTPSLRSGSTRSCGCIRREQIRARRRCDDPKMQEHRRIANKLRDHMGSTIERIKAKGGRKDRKTVELLGCSIAMLIEHLEAQFAPGMTWANHGSMWEIDHIMPLARFNLTDAGHVRMAARYTNLQPLWKEQNAAKGDKIIPHQGILL